MSKFPKLTDESKMPFSKYAGKKMSEVPDWYLKHLLEERQDVLKRFPNLKEYIEDNLDLITKNIELSKCQK